MSRFHRSRLFWLGLPGFIFLGWLWLWAPPRQLQIGGSDYLQVLAYPDALEFAIVGSRIKFPWHIRTSEARETDRAHPFKPFFKFQRMKMDSLTYTYLSMRPWIPIFAYSTLWLGMLAIWLRRKSRLMAAAIQA